MCRIVTRVDQTGVYTAQLFDHPDSCYVHKPIGVNTHLEAAKSLAELYGFHGTWVGLFHNIYRVEWIALEDGDSFTI